MYSRTNNFLENGSSFGRTNQYLEEGVFFWKMDTLIRSIWKNGSHFGRMDQDLEEIKSIWLKLFEKRSVLDKYGKREFLKKSGLIQ